MFDNGGTSSTATTRNMLDGGGTGTKKIPYVLKNAGVEVGDKKISQNKLKQIP